MKPPRFEYDDPRTLDETLGLLAAHGDEATVLAGGQTLMPLLNFRLVRPARLVDVNGLEALAYVHADGGPLRIGALARQAALEGPSVAEGWPLLHEAARLTGHPATRNRGTVAGSVAHGDPAAELPAALVALDARFHVRSARAARSIDAVDMFRSYFTTALGPDELLVEVEVPRAPDGAGCAFVEFARRHGDFALGGVAAVVVLGGDGSCSLSRLVLLAAGPTPLRARDAEEWLVGRPVDEETTAEAAARAAALADPPGDIHGSAAYRRRLLETLARRALARAASRAGAAGK